MHRLPDIQEAAHAALEPGVIALLEGGAADEITVRSNERAWRDLRLRQRVLVDVSTIDTSLDLLGRRLSHPILLAPTGYHLLFHPKGEAETARGAALAESVLVVSTFATQPIEQIADAAPSAPRWFQLYTQPDRSFTLDLMRRAEAAGCEAIVVTVDTPVIGWRDRENASGFELPPGVRRVHLDGLDGLEAGAAHRPSSRHIGEPGSIYSATHDPAATWSDLEWLASETQRPVIAKGISEPDDAERAVEVGCAGVIVSNHGGRNLDTLPATEELLEPITQRIGERAVVMVDGGIRRGTDVLKALALGADAVLIGRPQLWGLAAQGAQGVATVVRLLRTELEMAMALVGAPSLGQIDHRCIVRPRAPSPSVG